MLADLMVNNSSPVPGGESSSTTATAPSAARTAFMETPDGSGGPDVSGGPDGTVSTGRGGGGARGGAQAEGGDPVEVGLGRLGPRPQEVGQDAEDGVRDQDGVRLGVVAAQRGERRAQQHRHRLGG